MGTHPLFIIEAMMPDMKIDNLMCTKRAFVEGRELEDNAFVIMNLKGSENIQAGAQVYCWASSINCGARHYHKIRVVGSKAVSYTHLVITIHSDSNADNNLFILFPPLYCYPYI